MDSRIIEAVRDSQVLSRPEDMNDLIDGLGQARIVLLGESTHGTSEFYTWRAEITRRLIAEKGFFLIGVEGDWAACYRTNLYMAGQSDNNLSPSAVLNASFERWPTWMWANQETALLVQWLRDHNINRPTGMREVKFYGLDLYGLWESLEEISGYLERVDPHSAPAARQAFECFEPFRGLEEYYASARRLVPDTCREEVIALLKQVRERSREYPEDTDSQLNVRQNALVIANAEKYYTELLAGGAASWNVRDRHMVESIEHILKYFDAKYHFPAKMVIWAHNTHVGDARATDMIRYGMINIGQLLREDYPGEVKIVGFDSYHGRVIAAKAWDGQIEELELPEARSGSWERLLHQAGPEDRIVVLDETFHDRRGQRAVGVVYHPRAEAGNYVPTVLSERYDYLVFVNRSQALHPLAMEYASRGIPETYPSGV